VRSCSAFACKLRASLSRFSAARKLARGADLDTLAKIDAEIDAAKEADARAKDALAKQPKPGEQMPPETDNQE
jgi:hypothetical protein